MHPSGLVWIGTSDSMLQQSRGFISDDHQNNSIINNINNINNKAEKCHI